MPPIKYASRRLGRVMAIIAIVAGIVTFPAQPSFAQSGAPSNIGSQSRSTLATNQLVPSVDVAPEGTYDTSVTFCDAKEHTFWSGITYFVIYYNNNGHWRGHNWQDYDVVECTYGGCFDVGYFYRWC
jgi:hypothetical protein